MIDPKTIAEIQRLLALKTQSQRTIAKLTGVSRGSVASIASGKRRNDIASRPRDDGLPEPSGPPVRCRGCGALVYMPCLLCRLRKENPRPARRPTYSRPASACLDLRPEHRIRYEEVRSRRMAASHQQLTNPQPHTTMNEPIHADYADVRREIRNGDLLLFRRRNVLTRLIAVAGRSQYVHAAMAGWWHDRLMCVEMTAGGGRAQLLSNIVEQWPGVIDVYEANAERRRFSRRRALLAMIGITGRRYGWANLARAALLHLPAFRFLVHPNTNDAETSTWPPFCSQAVSMADRAGGIDPRRTSPIDSPSPPTWPAALFIGIASRWDE